jgi:hypothetical protein
VLYSDTASDIPAVDDLFLRYFISPCMKCSWLVKHVFGMYGWLHIQQAALNTAEPHVALKWWLKLYFYPSSHSHAHRYTAASAYIVCPSWACDLSYWETWITLLQFAFLYKKIK